MGTKKLGVLLHRLISGCRGRIGWGSCSLDRRGAAFCLVGEAVVAAAEKGEVVEVGWRNSNNFFGSCFDVDLKYLSCFIVDDVEIAGAIPANDKHM